MRALEAKASHSLRPMCKNLQVVRNCVSLKLLCEFDRIPVFDKIYLWYSCF